MNKYQIVVIEGNSFFLHGTDFDTDRIIPARFLKDTTFDTLGKYVFADDREQAKGLHPFDLEVNRGSSILVTDAYFGSGSSREHAVHALKLFGIRAIIAPQFGPIFRKNAVENGMVCLNADQGIVRILVKGIEAGNRHLAISLETMAVTQEACILEVTMPETDQQTLMEGLWGDPISLLLEAGDLIRQTAERIPASAITPTGGTTV